MVRAASLAMGLTAWFVILPLSLASLTSGIVQGSGSAWGLFRHYWILFKLLLTAIATMVLLLKLGPISELANAAESATFSSADLIGLRSSMLVHAGGGLLALLAAVTLAMYKPPGMTPYGLRKQRHATLGSDDWPGTTAPRWVKVVGVIAIVLILLVGIMLLVDGHGAAAHARSGA